MSLVLVHSAGNLSLSNNEIVVMLLCRLKLLKLSSKMSRLIFTHILSTAATLLIVVSSNLVCWQQILSDCDVILCVWFGLFKEKLFTVSLWFVVLIKVQAAQQTHLSGSCAAVLPASSWEKKNLFSFLFKRFCNAVFKSLMFGCVSSTH